MMPVPVPTVPYSDIVRAAQHGSPMLLSALGRMIGLGEEERRALGAGTVPWWFWVTAGAALGLFAGIQVMSRWPDKVPDALRPR